MYPSGAYAVVAAEEKPTEALLLTAVDYHEDSPE
jgi:hypothetical protein